MGMMQKMLNTISKDLMRQREAAIERQILPKLAELGYLFEPIKETKFQEFAIRRMSLETHIDVGMSYLYLDKGKDTELVLARWSEKVDVSVDYSTVKATIG